VLSPVIFMDTLALSPNAYGLLMLAYGGTNLIGGVLAHQVAQRVTGGIQMRLGLGLIIPASVIMGSLHALLGFSATTVLAGACVLTCGIALARPAATNAAMNALPERAGAAAAGLNTITFVGGGLVSFALSLAADQITWLLPTALLAMGVAGLGICALPVQRPITATTPAPE
jgi:DHA1 family bicyclomycin/chloramphenicol resistance-like MFS transporter